MGTADPCPRRRPPAMRPAAPTCIRWSFAAYAWRLLAIGAALAAALWLLAQLLVDVMPVAVAALLTRALAPIAGWLRRPRMAAGLAALTTVLGALLTLGAVFGVAGASVVSELGELGDAAQRGRRRRGALAGRGQSLRCLSSGRAAMARSGG